jgi:hypothetical protein
LLDDTKSDCTIVPPVIEVEATSNSTFGDEVLFHDADVSVAFFTNANS